MDIFSDQTWQMSLGERAAIVGLLTQLKPALALEIGTAEGASLRAIAAHCDEVHAFDLVEPSITVPNNAVLHTGDSHVLLRSVLEELAASGRNVDFVLVDGDHSAEGVKQDLEDLLSSAALASCVIVIHDTANEEVRRGIDAVHFAAWPKVASVELDGVPGQLFREPALHHELWYGLGLVRIDVTRKAYAGQSIYQQRYYPSAQLLVDARDVLVQRESANEQIGYGDLVRQLSDARGHIDRGYREARAPLEHELAQLRGTLEAKLAELAETSALLDRSRTVQSAMATSLSWRLTAPLRRLKATLR